MTGPISASAPIGESGKSLTFSTGLLALAWLLHRRLLLVQSIGLALAAVLRALLFDLSGNSHQGFWQSPLYHVSITALILLAALPFAFKLRDPQFWSSSPAQPIDPFARALRSPEQWFFFSAFALMVVALAAKLTSGHRSSTCRATFRARSKSPSFSAHKDGAT